MSLRVASRPSSSPFRFTSAKLPLNRLTHLQTHRETIFRLLNLPSQTMGEYKLNSE